MIRCPVSDCPADVQRTVDGNLADGLLAHMRYVHPELHFNTVQMLLEQALNE